MRKLAFALTALVYLNVGAVANAQEQGPVPYLDKLPKLVDRDLFFGDPQISGAQISPDGRFISFRKPYHDQLNIWVKGKDEPFDAARPITADTARPVRGYGWSRDGKYVLYVQDKGGNENFHLYAVDPAAEAEAATGVPPARDLTPYENVQARLIAAPKATPNILIVGLNDRDPQLHDVYRLNIATGERELLIKNTDNVAGWTADLDGKVRLATRLGPTGETEVLAVDGEKLTPVYTCSNEETCGPIRFTKDDSRVYFITNKGDDVDLTRLVLFDPATGKVEPVESDPEKQVDFGGAEFSEVTDELVATYYVGDRLRIYPKTKAFEHDLQILRNKLPEGEIGFGSATADESLQIVSVSRDVDPGSAYLYDRKRGDVKLLYHSRPDLPSDDLASMKATRYQARDGLEIPAYLTLPKGVQAKSLAVVVMPHGGPWARDVWGYDPYAQFLANRGYAVLQPNFRGSTGYGKKFLNAGNDEWGTGAMQHDISDGVKYLVDQGIADPSRVAIFGGSYGGYATLAGVAFTPDLYAAGVDYVGPSNLLTLLKSIPPYWAPLRKIFDVRVGDPDNPADRERLKEQSPLFSADQIKAPLLVIQGANDPRVKKAEAEQIVTALRDLGRPVEYLLAPNEGHGFANRDNRLAVAAAMEHFLAEHVGGRYQQETSDETKTTLAKLTVDVSTVKRPETASAEAAAGAAENAMTAPLPKADGSKLEPATLRYSSTLEAGGRSLELQASRQIASAERDGQAVWRVVANITTPMGSAVDTFEVDHGTVLPVYRHSAGNGSMTFHYAADSVTGEIAFGAQKVPVNAKFEAPVFGDGTALDLAIASLPLAQGYTTTLRTYDPQMQKVRPMKLSVTGSEQTTCQAGQYETFVVDLQPLDGDDTGHATLRLMKAAPHWVVTAETKLPAMMGGGMAHTELVGTEAGATR